MPDDDFHFFREDRTAKWRRIARHVARHPEDLSIALENIARWLALGRVHPAPILQWQEMIHAALRSSSAERGYPVEWLPRFRANFRHTFPF